ncbi:MAG: Gldg family protein [Gammaproteobacteria bacterium]
MWRNIWIITKKELRDYFSSSAALLFLTIFLASAYVVFFWLEAFFARNLADIRPLFSWFPILFIFLVSALTMHSWSEERRSGTIELILTSSISPWAYILGKFFAVLILVVVALGLTLPLPMTASILGDLDWGPVLGGYIAALFLTAGYCSIGLWTSSQTQNQIVSLILSIVIMGLLYALGTSTVTNLFTYNISEWLHALATSSRFESITRGVLDLRDIVYYLTIVIFFLVLTYKKVESLRSENNIVNSAPLYRHRCIILLVATLLILNLGLNLVTQARIDLTEGNVYTLSSATKDNLSELDKPLLIRGYFSNSTHPLLSPLVPRIRDLLNEYSVQGKGNVQIEFIDPLYDAEFEQEAGTKYGIQPVSFHSESKYQASVINTYFNVLIEYNDQYEVLGYKDLVDLKSSAGKHEVDLNNPEYQITRTIRSVMAKEKRQVDTFNSITDPIVLSGYVSTPTVLPDSHKKIIQLIQEMGLTFSKQSNDNFDFLLINPDDDQLTQEYLKNKVGVRPIASENPLASPYWFYFTLTDGKKTVPVSFSSNADKSIISQSIFSAYKNLLPDSIKTVALMRPIATPGPAGISESPGIPKHFSIIRKALQQSIQIIDVDLRDGNVPDEVDFLMVLAPRFLHPTQISAIQNFLMNGGNVLIASSSIDVNVSYFTEVYPVQSGLESWLAELGITIGDSLVLDNQHGQYSLPVTRKIGGNFIRETNLVNYPYIIDVRGEGLNEESGITAKLGQIYVPWTSPIIIDYEQNKNRTITPLLLSSSQSWSSSSKSIIPDFETYPDSGFETKINGESPQLLGTMIEGMFGNDKAPSKLIVIGSSALFTDNFLDKMSQVLRNEYRRPVQLMQNLIDWSLEDKSLLGVLRKHSRFTRTLTTLNEQEKKEWEYINYGLGMLGLLLIGLTRIYLNKRKKLRGLKLLHYIQ